MKKITVQAECDSCGATGLYRGFCEPKGEAVVCIGCSGTGCFNITFTPFKQRKGKRGIKIVRNSLGSFIATGVGGVGRSITYKQFAKGEMP